MKIVLELSVTLEQATNLVLASQACARHSNWRVRAGGALAGAIGQQLHEAWNEPAPPSPPILKLVPKDVEGP